MYYVAMFQERSYETGSVIRSAASFARDTAGRLAKKCTTDGTTTAGRIDNLLEID